MLKWGTVTFVPAIVALCYFALYHGDSMVRQGAFLFEADWRDALRCAMPDIPVAIERSTVVRQ